MSRESSLVIDRDRHFDCLQPRSLGGLYASSKNPGCNWSRGSENQRAKNKGGEEEQIIVAMTKVTLSGPERSLPPRL